MIPFTVLTLSTCILMAFQNELVQETETLAQSFCVSLKSHSLSQASLVLSFNLKPDPLFVCLTPALFSLRSVIP